MTRGDVLLVQAGGGATTKARPCVVVQRTAALADSAKITACPMTSTIGPDALLRPVVEPTVANGLRRTSQVEIDWIFTEQAFRFGSTIGVLDETVMREIDRALRLWLDL